MPTITSVINNVEFVDISGCTTGNYGRLSCNNWSIAASSHYGLIVTDLGIFQEESCFNKTLPVACCAPAQ